MEMARLSIERRPESEATNLGAAVGPLKVWRHCAIATAETTGRGHERPPRRSSGEPWGCPVLIRSGLPTR